MLDITCRAPNKVTCIDTGLLGSALNPASGDEAHALSKKYGRGHIAQGRHLFQPVGEGSSPGICTYGCVGVYIFIHTCVHEGYEAFLADGLQLEESQK